MIMNPFEQSKKQPLHFLTSNAEQEVIDYIRQEMQRDAPNSIPTEDELLTFFQSPDKPTGLDASEIAVYDHLLCLEDRRTYQCWPSDTTMDNAVGRAKNTVMRYVDALTEKGLIYVEPTSVLMCATPPDRSVRPWNSSILVRWQLECAAERQQIQRKLSAMDLLPGA